MGGLVDLVEVSCFVGWDEGFSGAVDFFDVLSELVLEFKERIQRKAYVCFALLPQR